VKIVHLEETDSTNRWLREEGGEEDVLVWTDYQSAGRGCGTNRWESERGKNLLFSLLIHPVEVRPSEQFRISMSISLAIVSALSDYTDGWSIKWPNDIYWHDRKICGILIENRLSGGVIKDCIIGVGLNVNQQVFMSDAPNPVSLRQILGHDVEREVLLHKMLDRFSISEDDGPRYRSLLYRRTGYYPYRDAEGDFEAEILAVEDDGHLLLKDRTGRERRYAFKEVAFGLGGKN
jgi:BirA family biotin operon repressor/biotin-[acetyl-CoA-carboxylase] ligase